MSTSKEIQKQEYIRSQVNIRFDLFSQEIEEQLQGRAKVEQIADLVFITFPKLTVTVRPAYGNEEENRYDVEVLVPADAGQVGESTEYEDMTQDGVLKLVAKIDSVENPIKREDTDSNQIDPIQRVRVEGLVEKLRGLLRVNEEQIFAQNGRVYVTLENLEVGIQPEQDDSYTVASVMGETPLGKDTGLSYGDLIKKLFDVVEALNLASEFSKSQEQRTDEESEDLKSDYYQLAKENGDDDFLKNRSLVDLRGLSTRPVINGGMNKRPFVTLHEQLSEVFGNKPSTDQPSPAKSILGEIKMPGKNQFRGLPVSLNENRNPDLPFRSEYKKKLIMHPELGAIFVDKDMIPEKDVLTWKPGIGVTMVPESQHDPECRKDMHYFRGY